ncbi:hypothetical protein BaRGS_00033016 [Batillaria attramentaria]|uniref:Uncharacterized protein n=1 Tax=Batillaria attramentaria TaxID=370345 RepID=A0ABD0JL70_9CAEN
MAASSLAAFADQMYRPRREKKPINFRSWGLVVSAGEVAENWRRQAIFMLASSPPHHYHRAAGGAKCLDGSRLREREREGGREWEE